MSLSYVCLLELQSDGDEVAESLHFHLLRGELATYRTDQPRRRILTAPNDDPSSTVVQRDLSSTAGQLDVTSCGEWFQRPG